MRETTERRQTLNNTVGRRSSWQVDNLDFWTIFDTLIMGGRVKLENNWQEDIKDNRKSTSELNVPRGYDIRDFQS